MRSIRRRLVITSHHGMVRSPSDSGRVDRGRVNEKIKHEGSI